MARTMRQTKSDLGGDPGARLSAIRPAPAGSDQEGDQEGDHEGGPDRRQRHPGRQAWSGSGWSPMVWGASPPGRPAACTPGATTAC